MTKLFGVPILIDEQTADFVNRLLPDNEGRCRHLGRVRPVGLDADVMAWELMPPAHCDGTIDDVAISQHQQAVEAFTAGRWDEARRLIEGLPPHDQASRLLISFMDEHQSTPPDAWDGIIPLKTK